MSIKSTKSIKVKLMTYVSIPVVLLVTLFLVESYREISAEFIDGRAIALEQKYHQVLDLIHSQALISYSLFLRLHKVEKHGDDLSGFRYTVVEANKEKQPRIGIEKGVAGMGIRAVAPVSFQGKHVGTVEFGTRLNDKLVMPLKEKYNADISIVVPDGNEYKFQAKTHTMKILPQSYLILNKVMTSDRDELGRAAQEIGKVAETITKISDQTNLLALNATI